MLKLRHGRAKKIDKWTSQVVLVVKNPPAHGGSIRNAASVPGLARSLGGGHGKLLHYSCLENPMNRGAWQVIVPRVPWWGGLHAPTTLLEEVEKLTLD